MKRYRVQANGLLFLAVFLITGMAHPQAADSLISYIDEHNRFILNGEPFFPLGLYVVQPLTGVDLLNQLDEIGAADSPFDTLMNYNINNGNDSQITSYLNILQSRNMKLIFSIAEYFGDGEDDIGIITEKINTFKGHSTIISWYMNDEVGPEYLTELEAGYATIRQLDDNHPVWSVHWNTDWLLPEAHTTDILGMDSYPIAHLPITEVSRVAEAAAQVGTRWSLMGTYPFAAGTSGNVVISDNDDAGYVIADAIKFAPATIDSIVIDEDAATFAGSGWNPLATGNANAWNNDHRSTLAGDGDTATFTG
jgi:hypothetical protein